MEDVVEEGRRADLIRVFIKNECDSGETSK